MPSSIVDAREELRALVANGVDLRFRPQGTLVDRPLRRSAVLVLFGSLDRQPAETWVSTVPPELDVLLMRRSDQLRHHAGQISFPGGGVEPGDVSLAATALREASEETGLDPSGVEILGALSDVHIPVSNNLVTPIVGWWTDPSPVQADESESLEVFRAPVAELLDPALRGTSVITRGGSTFRGQAFELQPQGHIVWGFTGIVLANLFDLLGWSVPWDATREIEVSA